MAKVKKSSLAAKLGERGAKAVEAHRDDETRLGAGSRLPEGIEGGVARLVDCRFGQFEKGDNKGEFFFIARGVVLRPKDHGGVAVEGMHTQIGPEPMCDTPKRSRPGVDDHVDWVLNEMRKLGADTSEADVGDLEQMAADLRDTDPGITFRFRTWKGDKQTTGPFKDREPRVNEQWEGACEYDEEDEGEDVVDETDDEDEEPVAKKGKAAKKEEPEKEKESGDDDEDEDEEEASEPEVGELYMYKPPKGKKKIECEVVKVFAKAQKVTLKDLDDKSVYKDVPWDELDSE
jgi:hypothetical protein